MPQDLITPWGEALAGTPWPVYPRPQMRRAGWLNLNGMWDFAATGCPEPPVSFDRTIRVPFCPESLLSGIRAHFPEGSYLYYSRQFCLPPEAADRRVLLHIGAADQRLECYVNSRRVGSHAGGYTPMTFDITEALEAENTLLLRVRDDLGDKTMPYGKQVTDRGGMWYTPVSGVWQTVWIEWVPELYIRRLDISTGDDGAELETGEPRLNGRVTVQTPQGDRTFPLTGGRAKLGPLPVRRWSPEDPYLYEFTVEAGQDRVAGYFALRTLETKKVDGLWRLCLNGKPYFFHGLLDQGYWSDGLYTPASPECYAWDIQTMKSLGFNTLRKHIKVEPEEFYYQCDRLGMVVFQDMVNNGDYAYLRDTALPTLGFQVRPDRNLHRDRAARTAFFTAMEETVDRLKNHPCIVYWTIFNEGWGQFDASAAYDRLRALDSTRWIDSTSGWFRWGRTDVDSRHIYFGQWRQLRPSEKPTVLSEFGGFCYREEGHIFNPKRTYGYHDCPDRAAYRRELAALYEQRIIPAIRDGLCAAIYTQVSDVEDEINGLVTYDRRMIKADPAEMTALARRLAAAIAGEQTPVQDPV